MPEAVTSLAAALISVLLAACLGRLWHVDKRKRELDLENAREFHQLYGEFFAVWKLWEMHCERRGKKLVWDDKADAILHRAVGMESRMEALVGQLASQRDLKDSSVQLLGHWRQDFQVLRESIRDLSALGWSRSNHGKYRSFKKRATEVAGLIQSGKALVGRRSRRRSIRWLKITSNDFER